MGGTIRGRLGVAVVNCAPLDVLATLDDSLETRAVSKGTASQFLFRYSGGGGVEVEVRDGMLCTI